ncbi:PTS galactosamine/N-acetylgalactosamine transporter subunit IIA [Virgibacillus sp. Bac330]|uniref:PTS galactosamine/N-acetylgalactosamine transporter subunit IIA n=1 Tax=Virgibacillus sp. Bac330 TaxID=2419841 RepID=UPI000EF5062D|nr:PTS galactosamine/N-acetylgalactosamine transporter subunit IIA [Virgibacillus sp. Bac330]
MTGVVITGHGFYASGVKSTIQLIAGEQHEVKYVDFLESDEPSDLREKLEHYLDSMNNVTNILFLTDIVGGTPFKISAQILQERKIAGAVVAGANISMVLEVLFTRENATLSELKQTAIQAGISGIKILPKE